MNHRVPDGSVASSHRPRELFWRQLRNHMKQPFVCLVAIVVQTFQIFDGHRMLLISGSFQREPTVVSAQRLAHNQPKACGATFSNLTETVKRSNYREAQTGALWVTCIPLLARLMVILPLVAPLRGLPARDQLENMCGQIRRHSQLVGVASSLPGSISTGVAKSSANVRSSTVSRGSCDSRSSGSFTLAPPIPTPRKPGRAM